jgi:hypothetical protein
MKKGHHGVKWRESPALYARGSSRIVVGDSPKLKDSFREVSMFRNGYLPHGQAKLRGEEVVCMEISVRYRVRQQSSRTLVDIRDSKLLIDPSSDWPVDNCANPIAVLACGVRRPQMISDPLRGFFDSNMTLPRQQNNTVMVLLRVRAPAAGFGLIYRVAMWSGNAGSEGRSLGSASNLRRRLLHSLSTPFAAVCPF